MKEPALVICPGRGTYTKDELGYLTRRGGHASEFIARIDAARRDLGQPSVSELDAAANYSMAVHTPGENASSLIYACSMADFMAIDRDRFDIVAVTGNSMGWYTALGAAGAMDDAGAFTLVNTMGSMMRDGAIGGQIVYPAVGEDWRDDPDRRGALAAAVNEINARGEGRLWTSIEFGGYRVTGGDEPGLKALMAALPRVEGRFPMRLVNHAAFHTPLMEPISRRAMEELPGRLFGPPRAPLIDGRGKIWQPFSTDPAALRDYTLGRQVTRTYDFTAAMTVALREFAPARLILLGPGSAMGGAIGQVLVKLGWRGIASKADFLDRQREEPYLLAMGREDQREIAAAPAFAARG